MTWLDAHDLLHLEQLHGLEAGAAPWPDPMTARLAQGQGRER
jgi:hypothetical protein